MVRWHSSNAGTGLPEQNSNGRHGLMYFDIALNYHATIKVAQHEQIQIKNPEQDYDSRPLPPPFPDWLRHADSIGNCSRWQSTMSTPW